MFPKQVLGQYSDKREVLRGIRIGRGSTTTQVQQHDGQYRDGCNERSRYSADRGSDYKVITSLFKNQTRNKTNESGGVPERMMEQRPVQQQQHQAQWIPQQPPPQLPQQQAPIQQAQPQPQQIQQQQLHQQQSSYDDHYDSYGDSKMPKDAKFPYNPPANATIQSVEIGQTDIPKYPPPQPQESATSNVAALNVRSQISPRQIVATPQQQQQYQLLFIIP
ncbi:hypothetical protein pipiens_009495 [Culex pipiens pipiens]|uniref:Uncharacterized protein n=1 Tax=Culex pipiens pipiens TaxID=38569 RepID=A0ABD1DDU6_CULPP